MLGAIYETYGVDLGRARMLSYWSRFARGANFCIGTLALFNLFRNKWPDAILSRNLYASYVIAVLKRRPIIFETHQLEVGTRKGIQRAIMTRPWVRTVIISKKLKECLIRHHGVAPSRTFVLPDAAPRGIVPIKMEKRRTELFRVVEQVKGDWNGVCGYFGHLYEGRGIEIIEAMAEARHDVLFLIFGGNEQDVQIRRRVNRLDNLHFLGYVPHTVSLQAMRTVDVLLMPYQESVSIGVKGHDTARWMSPMKMFEYMATGVPIISSDLPVLKEVLRDGENAILVPPSDIDCWVQALEKILKNSCLAKNIGRRAHQDYKENYTWTKRATRLVEIM
jgi:glycosyltransferase involved in cell wall biosynthesis